MPLDNLDKWVEEIQKEIIEEEIKRYNKFIVELFQNPKNWGKPPDDEISVWHAYEGSCGDTMQFFLKIKEDIIEKANILLSKLVNLSLRANEISVAISS